MIVTPMGQWITETLGRIFLARNTLVNIETTLGRYIYNSSLQYCSFADKICEDTLEDVLYYFSLFDRFFVVFNIHVSLSTIPYAILNVLNDLSRTFSKIYIYIYN